jgi:hypothetical protein
VAQDPVTGFLTLATGSLTVVDWSAYKGIWFPCAGITSPWQSHVGSEEYPPDARTLQVCP